MKTPNIQIDVLNQALEMFNSINEEELAKGAKLVREIMKQHLNMFNEEFQDFSKLSLPNFKSNRLELIEQTKSFISRLK